MNLFEKFLYFLQGEMTQPTAFGWFHILWLVLVVITIFVLYKNAVDKHLQLDNLIIEENYLKCSEKGFGLLNSILVDFME